ncbi:hypothetical protein [Helicobacter cetorum]|uniref:hypothetical protein n=1 Tax=Helicobacter cetorum TaxID=138563 RepID=UPI0013152310|nr:hypothetical protein [Helicobacter cetorum]
MPRIALGVFENPLPLQLMVYIREDNDINMPHIYVELFWENYVYGYIIPYSSKDKKALLVMMNIFKCLKNLGSLQKLSIVIGILCNLTIQP